MSPAAPENERSYQCPGERYTISHAQHLARLATLYEGCRECPHRQETGVLSARIKRQIDKACARPRRTRLFEQESVGGIYLNEFTLPLAQRLSAALGVVVQREVRRGGENKGVALASRQWDSESGPEYRQDAGATASHSQQNESRGSAAPRSPRVILSSDGSPLAPEVLAAASAGLRWAGCQVVEIGQATAPSAAQAIVQLDAEGGVFVGNFRGRSHEVGVMFWAAGARPLSAGGTLDEIERLAEGPLSRPVRHSAGATRGRNEAEYAARLAPHYHALRPLRVAVDAESPLWRVRFEKLLEHVACSVTPVLRDRAALETASSAEAGPPVARVRQAVRQTDAHFGIWTDAAGERLGVVDEHGQPVPVEQLLVALAESLLAEYPDGAIVVEAETPAAVCDALTSAGARVFLSGSTREAMDQSMREHLALLGGGPSGRLYFCGQPPAADSLLAVTHLLVKLSQSDRPLSRVVREAMGGGIVGDGKSQGVDHAETRRRGEKERSGTNQPEAQARVTRVGARSS